MKNRRRTKNKTNKKRAITIVLSAMVLLACTATMSFGTWQNFLPDFSNNRPAQTGINSGVTLSHDDRGLIQSSRVRGNIYDRRFSELAGSYVTQAVYAKPFEIATPSTVASQLADILGKKPSDVLASLTSESSFVWISRQLTKEQTEKISAAHLPGIYLHDQAHRVYPHKQAAAHALGFIQKNQGLDGLESYYDNLLQGGAIQEATLPVSKQTGVEQIGKEGAHLILTLDLKIQNLLAKKLASVMTKSKATTGQALLMSARTGAILAMVNLPAYDPNAFWDYQETKRQNRIISEPLLSSRSTQAEPPTKTAPMDLQRLLELLDIGHSFAIDLPDNLATASPAGTPRDPASSASSLQLLAAFSCALNGGHEIKPHLLATIRDRATHKEIHTNYGENGRMIVSFGQKTKIIQAIKDSLRPGPVNSQLLEISSSTAQHSKISHGKMPLGENSAPDEENISRQIVLAAIPGEKPELTLLIQLENMPLPGKSQGHDGRLLAMGQSLISKCAKLAKEPSPVPSNATWKTKTKKDYGKAGSSARAVMDQNHRADAQKRTNRMPQLTGKSLRKGLQLLQPYDLKIQVKGSGTIVSQKPRPGKTITKGSPCVLKLSMKL